MQMFQDIQSDKKVLEQLDEDEAIELQAQKSKLKQMFRDDDDDSQLYVPLIIKACQSGALETLESEARRLIGQHFQISILSSEVGPISDSDLSLAQSTGALILGFDVACPSIMEKKAESMEVPVRLHKLIYDFNNDIEDLIHDVKLKDQISRGELQANVLGEASI